ncbi:MAG: HAD family phosphatase [Phycisphaeraceae bacterium]
MDAAVLENAVNVPSDSPGTLGSPSSPTPVRAFIFDMDDTLVATSALWRDAEEHLLLALGAKWSPALAAKYKGMNALDVAATIWRELEPPLGLAQCQRIMRDRLLENFRRMPIREINGAVRLVRRCAEVGNVAMAVASGSPMEAIGYALEQLGIGDAFGCVLSSEAVPRGKPQPDVFLAVAQQLAVAPRACLVFEDSLIGAQAARAAGMACMVCPSVSAEGIATVASSVVSAWDQVKSEQLEQYYLGQAR